MSRPEWADRALSLVFPKRCVLCGEAVEYDQLACARCEPPRVEGARCPACGHPPEACTCVDGFAWGFDAAAHPLRYEGGVKLLILRLKEEPDRRAARFFAREMFALLDDRFIAERPELLAAVPMSGSKRRARGFNQAELLAEELGALCGLPLRGGLLTRAEDSLVQHELGRRDRFENALRSYQLGANANGLRGKCVLLIDDLFTTGATVHACALRLKQGGAGRVLVLTAAGTDRTAD